jgi:hypothetical protein
MQFFNFKNRYKSLILKSTDFLFRVNFSMNVFFKMVTIRIFPLQESVKANFFYLTFLKRKKNFRTFSFVRVSRKSKREFSINNSTQFL